MDEHDLKYKPFLGVLNVTIPFCDMLAGRLTGALLPSEFFFKNLKFAKNVQCPFKVNSDIILLNTEFQ